ncbi:MAG: DNA-processing protein DprA [Hyphomicrobiales bacterium]
MATFFRLTDDQRLAWLRLIRSENVGPRSFRDLINRFGGAEAALAALPELAARGGKRITRCEAGQARAELHRHHKAGATLVAWSEPDYPAALRQIYDAPPLISVKGRLALLGQPMVGIVGARNASALGLKLAGVLARDLSQRGLVVVSGLARGVDGAAHAGALEAATLAVMAGGLDVVYPPEHQKLHTQIGLNGVLLSEIAFGTQPKRQHFPRRNRLISGLARGVVIVEAAQKSGSLITARFAMEQNREVFAVPGSPLDPRAAGTNALIRDGATLTRSADDILEVLNPILADPGRLDPASAATSPHLPGLQEQGLDYDDLATQSTDPYAPPPDAVRDKVQALIGLSPVSVDELTRQSDAPVGDILSIILELDLAGKLVRHGQHSVSLAP